MPKKQIKKKPSPDSVRIPPDLKAALLSQAAKENRSFGNLVVTILKEWAKDRPALRP